MGMLDRLSGREAEQLLSKVQQLQRCNHILEATLRENGITIPRVDSAEGLPKDETDAIAVDAQLRRITEERDTLLRLRDIVAGLNQQTDLEALLEFIVKTFIDVTGSSRAFLILREGDSLKIRVALTASGERLESVEKMSRTLARQVARTGTPIRAGSAWREAATSHIDSIQQGQMESVLCLPLRNRDRTPFGAVYVDAPDRRDAFRNQDTRLLESFCDLAAVVLENLRQQERRLRTERLASVGLTANYLLHDLKTPLTVIHGCAEILRSESPSNAEMSDTIVRQVTRLTDMARDVYDFSRGLAGLERESCEATYILVDIEALFANEVKQRGVTLHISPTPGHVWAHRGKIVRVLANLVQNAVEALTTGGQVWVDYATNEAGGGEFRVRDDGPGLPEEISRHLFEAFYTSGKQSGRGLGMAIVHDIVTAHGGHISVGSGPGGKGTCFTVQLPQAPANA